MGNAKPPNPQGVPKQWGKKPKAPKGHKSSGRFDNGSGYVNGKGCAVTALAIIGGLPAVVGALGYAVWELL